MIQLDLVAGRNAGTSYQVEEQSFIIGRGRTNRIVLVDEKVSARHAQIECRADGYFLRDLSSTNGTFLNDQLAVESLLKEGDAVRIGQSILQVVKIRLDPNRPPTPPVSFSDASANPATVRLQVAQITRPLIDEHAAAAEIPTLAEAYRNLLAMYKVSSIVRSELELPKLLDEVLAQIFRNLRAERGVIMMLNDDGQLAPLASRTRNTDTSDGQLVISRTIAHEVIDRQEAILTTDATRDARFNPAASVMQQHIRSAMCCPISVKGRVFGIVYVDCRTQTGSFKQPDLELLAAIANEAGLAIENRMLRDANLKAERLAAVGQTVAGLSHYIKNIVSCMSTGSDLISNAIEGGDIDAVRKGWGIVSRNERKISDLVMDMLNYSAERKPVKRPCRINDIIEDVLDIVRPAIDDAGVRLELALAPDLPEVSIDATGILRSLLNLLTNAMDALSGRPNSVITIATEADAHTLAISVADNGPGIPPDIQPRIFDVFFTTKGDKGTGLGLAVVRKLVHEHAGEITVTSSPGAETRFTIRLPLA